MVGKFVANVSFNKKIELSLFEIQWCKDRREFKPFELKKQRNKKTQIEAKVSDFNNMKQNLDIIYATVFSIYIKYSKWNVNCRIGVEMCKT